MGNRKEVAAVGIGFAQGRRLRSLDSQNRDYVIMALRGHNANTGLHSGTNVCHYISSRCVASTAINEVQTGATYWIRVMRSWLFTHADSCIKYFFAGSCSSALIILRYGRYYHDDGLQHHPKKKYHFNARAR